MDRQEGELVHLSISRSGDNTPQSNAQTSDGASTFMQNSWTTDNCEWSGPSSETPSLSSPGEDDSSKEVTTPNEIPPLALIATHKQQSVRQRTAQACEKCRERKTKCSGHRPVCNRCTNRGHICEYPVRELRITTRRPPLRRDLIKISPPQPAQYSGVCRSPQDHPSRVGPGGTLRKPSPYYDTPPPYTPRRDLRTYDDKSQAVSVQNRGTRAASRNGLPDPTSTDRRPSADSGHQFHSNRVSDSSWSLAYSTPYEPPPHQSIPIIRVHEEYQAYMRDDIVSTPVPVTTLDSSRSPFDFDMPQVPSVSLLRSLYHDFDHDASPYRTRLSPSQGRHHRRFPDEAPSCFTPARNLRIETGDYWPPVHSSIIPPPPPPMRTAANLHPEYTSEDLNGSPVSLYGDRTHPTPSSPNHSDASSQAKLMPSIPIGVGVYSHDTDVFFGMLGESDKEPIYFAPIRDSGDRFNSSLFK